LLRLGVHVSTAGKIYKAVDRAVELGCNAMQIFSRNPRSFRRKTFEEGDVSEFRIRRKNAGIFPLSIHAVYTQNLAGTDFRLYRLSIRDFILDLQDARQLGADLVVTHTGSFKGGSYSRGMEKAVSAFDKILNNVPKGITILLENISGSGSWLGSRISELAYIIKRLGFPKNMGICLDTCHAFSAGYNIREGKGLNLLVKEIDSLLGLERLKLIHLNDTKDELGSRKDRHEHIGRGKLGENGISGIINHPRLKGIPLILETPGKSDGDDRVNLESVRRIYKG